MEDNRHPKDLKGQCVHDRALIFVYEKAIFKLVRPLFGTV